MVEDDPDAWSRTLLAVMSAGLGALFLLSIAGSLLGPDPEDHSGAAQLAGLALVSITGLVAACIGRYITWFVAIAMGCVVAGAATSALFTEITAPGAPASPGLAIVLVATALLGLASVVTAIREWSRFRGSRSTTGAAQAQID